MSRIRSYLKPPKNADLPIEPALADLFPRKILFGGDTHGDANHVRWLIDRAFHEHASAVFVLGDFGIWDHLDGGRFTDSVSKWAGRSGIPVLFLPGNHDNYDLLFEYEATKPRDEDGFVILKPWLGYSPRGHRWTWNNIRFMSLGGAYSIDKDYRVRSDEARLRSAQIKQDRGSKLTARERNILRTGQESWWAQEEISQEELDYALRPGGVDVLLTHDKPRAASPGWDRKDKEECWENQEAIQEVVDEKNPKVLLHGHLHYSYDQFLSNKTWVKALDCDPEASRYSGGSGDKDESYAVMELLAEEKPSVRVRWAGRTFGGCSDNITRDFDLSL